MGLSPAQQRHYETFGFVLVQNLLSPDEIDTICSEHAAALASAQAHRDGAGENLSLHVPSVLLDVQGRF